MTPELAEIIARIPAWHDRADLQTSFLSGGITNRNYRVDVGGASYVLRVGGAKTELLGIDRAVECAAHRAAAAVGIAPPIYSVLEPEQYLVTQFISGREIPPEEMRAPETLRAVAAVLKRVHALPPLPHRFSPFAVVRAYDRLAREHGVTTFPQNYAWLRQRMAEIERQLDLPHTAAVLCHNDLLNGNLIRDAEDRIIILDWEYAGTGDPFFDLANFAAHHELDDDQVRVLLQAYFGDTPPRAFARLQLQQVMSDFREAMWGILQQGISQLDLDFRSYADRFFAKLTARLHDPRYQDWLAQTT